MSRVLEPDGLPESTHRLYSQARVEDGVLFVSGQVGWDEANRVVGDDIESQTRQAFRNVGVVLDAVDAEYADVAKVTSYFVDIEAHLAPYKEVWAEFFDEPYPCHTALGVAGLADPDLLVEVEVEVPLDG